MTQKYQNNILTSYSLFPLSSADILGWETTENSRRVEDARSLPSSSAGDGGLQSYNNLCASAFASFSALLRC